MSYLPRMSKTYKEPEERIYEDPAKEITFNSIPIASALPDDKSFSPQTILKQYSFYPHPPPLLPGPSLIEEAEQNEQINREAKRRRTREETEMRLKSANQEKIEEMPFKLDDEERTINFALVSSPFRQETDPQTRTSSSRKSVRSAKTALKKTSLKTAKKKEEKEVKQSKTVSIVEASETAKSGNELDVLDKTEVEVVPKEKEVVPEVVEEKKERPKSQKGRQESASSGAREVKGFVQEAVQCSPPVNGEKIWVMPPSIHYLLRTLSFLVQELDKSEQENGSKETKKLVGQIEEVVAGLTNRNIDRKYSLQASVSDTKRLEKIYNDLEQYVKQVYGENGKIGCKSEEKKKLYCQVYEKECEVKVLNEKLRETEIQNPWVKISENQIKAPEIVLQNKDLENEQLLAEIEFDSIELKRYHKALAEKEWAIQNAKQEISSLKKKIALMKGKTKNYTPNRQSVLLY